ncbi:hypothetical protein DL96DRAFT_1644459 [Flagelloscypha sp. PMI_526]|nr:hypothetical protein DL96DRAFT_1644459 [Flagelloscypha sp. PMI_526]
MFIFQVRLVCFLTVLRICIGNVVRLRRLQAKTVILFLDLPPIVSPKREVPPLFYDSSHISSKLCRVSSDILVLVAMVYSVLSLKDELIMFSGVQRRVLALTFGRG